MKKICFLILVIVLIFPTVFVLAKADVSSAPLCYYVSQNGNDQNSGDSVLQPFKTLTAAVNALDDRDGTIYIMDTVFWSQDSKICNVPSHKGTITFAGLSEQNVENQIIDYCFDTSANATTASLHLMGDSIFKNITFRAHHFKSMYTNGYNLRLEGKIFYLKGASGNAEYTLTLGKYATKANQAQVYLGADMTIGTLNVGHNVSASIDGDARVIIDGTNIKKIALCGTGATLNNVDITHIRGNIDKFITTTNPKAAIRGTLRLVKNGGLMPELENPAGIVPAKTFEYTCDTGVVISPVGNTGTFFKVESDITVKATNISDGKQYYSSKGGYLGLPEGSYTITKAETNLYTNDGKTIRILKDTALTFDDYLYRHENDGVFVGWRYEGKTDGPKSGEILPAGTVICADFVPYDPEDSEFGMVGVQIREDNKQKSRSLRFVINKDKSFDKNFKITEYGAIVIPDKALDGKELVINEKYNFDSKVYAAGRIFSPKAYKTTENGELFTLCITGIDHEDHNTFYTARAYAICENANGESFVVYSSPIKSSLVNIARNNLPKSENDKAVFEKVISDWKNTYFGGGVTENPSTHFPNAYIVNETGVSVREITIDSGKNDGKTVQISMITDAHLNTNIPGHTQALEKALKCAAFADRMVLCGDNVESASSSGNMQLLQSVVWDNYPETICVLGNHEYFYKGSGTVDAVKEKVDALWPHDPDYYSTLVADKVLLVTVDNARQHDSDSSKYYFTADKVKKLQADIDLARENGYTILFFCHVPMQSLDLKYEANEQMKNLITSSADVIKACFSGHGHTDHYTTLSASYIDENGEKVNTKIPYYRLRGCVEDDYRGHVLFINVE